MAAYNRGDFITALSEWQRLAERGDADAQNNLGVMYFDGQGVVQDYKEAGKWYRKSAEQGDAGAKYNLGVMYTNGQGVPQDFKEAYAWSSAAAATGNADAVKNRDMAAKLLTPDQLAKGQALAKQYFEKYQPK